MNGRFQMQGILDFAEIDQCKPVLLGLSLAGYLVKPLLSLYGTEWRERGYGLREMTHMGRTGILLEDAQAFFAVVKIWVRPPTPLSLVS